MKRGEGVGCVYSRLYRLRRVQYRIQFPVVGAEITNFLGRLLATPSSPSFFKKKISLIRFFSPVHLHFIPQPSAKSNTFLFIAFLCFVCVLLPESALQSNEWTVCVRACARVRAFTVRVCLREIRTMCVCYLPPGCPENNCPECFLCLVMACCYLPPWRAEKK